MSQEIVFTSARHGLRTGSTGFCTVRSTRGMPGNLAQLLERLTGYTHVFDAYGEEARRNPVNFAHYIARLGDQRFHVLARVANAPLDHTNRSNKLAQLLAVESNLLEPELSEGPAAESMQIVWVREWSSETEPHVLPDEKQIVLPMAGQPKSGPCQSWKAATGDSGWAAVLASSAAESSAPLQVILPRDVGSRPEDWALNLVHEALSLLPREDRWNVSYSTNFGGNLPVSISCQWQFVIDGTDLAKRARLDPRARTIDIPAIAAGKMPAPQLPLTSYCAVSARPWDNRQSDSSIIRRRSSGSAKRTVPTGLQNELSANGTNSAVDRNAQLAAKQAGAIAQRTRKAALPLLLRPFSLLLFALVTVVTIIIGRQAFRTEPPSELQSIVAGSDAASRAVNEENKKRQTRDLELQHQREDELRRRKEEEEDAAKLAALAASKATPGSDADPEMHAPPELDSEPDQNTATPVQPPLQDVRDRGRRLELKLPSPGLNSGNDGPIHLARIHVTSPEHFELNRIIGGRSVLKSGLDLSLEGRVSQGQLLREWDVKRISTTGVGFANDSDVVGTFRLDQHSDLSFRWNKNNEGFEIINCLLEMEADEPGTKKELEKCTLRDITRIRPIQFDLNEGSRIERLVSRNQLTNTQALELECDFINFPGTVARKGAAVLRVGESVKFQIQGAPHGKYPRTVEITVRLFEEEQDVRVEISMKLDRPEWNPEKAKFEIRQVAFTPSTMNKIAADLTDMKNRIETKHDEREKAGKRKDQVLKEAAKYLNAKGEITDPGLKKQLEELKKVIAGLDEYINKWDPEYEQLQLLANDLNQLLDDISQNGQLQFSLRLMIPDAGAGGIELIVTDDQED